MGPDRNGRPTGNTKCFFQMCFYIHLSALLSLASSRLWFFSWHPQAPLATAESVSGMMKVITSLTEKDSGTLLDWEGKNIPWWFHNSSCVSLAHLEFDMYFHIFVCLRFVWELFLLFLTYTCTYIVVSIWNFQCEHANRTIYITKCNSA